MANTEIRDAADAVTRIAQGRYDAVAGRYSGLRGKVRNFFGLGMKESDRNELTDILASTRLANAGERIDGFVKDMYSVLTGEQKNYGLRTARVQANAEDMLAAYAK